MRLVTLPYARPKSITGGDRKSSQTQFVAAFTQPDFPLVALSGRSG
jgi:hypothetical protein